MCLEKHKPQGKELTYHRASEKQGTWTYLELQRSWVRWGLNLVGKLKVFLCGSWTHRSTLRAHTAGDSPSPLPGPTPSHQLSNKGTKVYSPEKLNWRDPRQGDARLSRDQERGTGLETRWPWAISSQILSGHYQNAYHQAHHGEVLPWQTEWPGAKASRSCLWEPSKKKLIGDLMTFLLTVQHKDFQSAC